MGTTLANIRPATPADEEAWFRLKNDRDSLAWSGLTQGTSREDHARWFQIVLQRPDWCLLVAEDNEGAVIGIAAFLVAAMAIGQGIIVDPEHRGDGIGPMMLARQEAEAKRRGCNLYGGVVDRANTRSWQMFWRRGFVLAQRMPTLLKALV